MENLKNNISAKDKLIQSLIDFDSEEVKRLEADNKRLRKDAERYRHIREGNHWVAASTRTGFYVDGEHLDELVDAALAQGDEE